MKERRYFFFLFIVEILIKYYALCLYGDRTLYIITTYDLIYYHVLKNESIWHYASTPMEYTAIFHGRKNFNFQMKNYNVFLFSCLL